MIRLPDGMRDRLKAEADESGRSMNAEIVSRLEESFRDPLVLPEDLLARIARYADDRGVTVRSEILFTLDKAYPVGLRIGEFIERWAIPVAQESSVEARHRLIEEANEDINSRVAGLVLKEVSMANGSPAIEVYREDFSDTELRQNSVLATIPIASGAR
ncbi:Arc family DNA-binding protein [Rhizobium rhizogenes]|uniref:Arc family DNA-binding protein n=1 Tax=Rhizobium rhizogenes TaxID=359 RepID=UPI00191CBA1C|nr:Arc family DNA-binding protein [Rhizobium rhizogenes]